jgi:hypothetical protein
MYTIRNVGHSQKTPAPARSTTLVEGGGSRIMLPLLLKAN